jgi:hypothetical protein
MAKARQMALTPDLVARVHRALDDPGPDGLPEERVARHAGAAAHHHGSNSQGVPERSTSRMPVSTARSLIRGRPPLGLGGSGGRSGSITAQRRLHRRGLLMPLQTRQPPSCQRLLGDPPQFFGRDGEDLVRFADRHKVTATVDLMPH